MQEGAARSQLLLETWQMYILPWPQQRSTVNF